MMPYGRDYDDAGNVVHLGLPQPPWDEQEEAERIDSLIAHTNPDNPDLIPDKPTSTLDFATIGQLIDRVAARGPRQWLIVGVWPAGAYGVHAAEAKAQKTWNGYDLAVSVASGTPWLNTYPIGKTGPVIIFIGEGGEESVVRRIGAIAASRKLEPADLEIHICTRAPHLGDLAHLAAMADKIRQTQPALVILDPLYLSVRGGSMADLYSMAPLLEAAQRLCEPCGVSLFVVTHFNRKEGKGAARFLGSGPVEWGRVLIGATVVSKHTDPDTRASTVVTDLDTFGGDIPDLEIRLRRYISAENPDDLDSPLTYEVETLAADETPTADLDLSPAANKILAAIRAHEEPIGAAQIVDWIVAEHGHGLRRETVSKTLNELQRRGLIDSVGAVGERKLWFVPGGVTG